MPDEGDSGLAGASSEKRPLLARSSDGGGGSRGRRSGVACSAAVLIAELLERTAFYGLAGNLVLYLTESPLCWSNSSAMSALLVLQGATYAFGLLGGWLSDSVTGKYGCILLGYVVYIVGYAFLFVHGYYVNASSSMHLDAFRASPAAGRCDGERRPTVAWCASIGSGGHCGWSLYLSLVAVGVGTALVRTNLGPFGADQVRNSGPRATQTFFSWYYWCINVGAFVAYTAIAYVQQFVDFAYGYLIPCCCLALSALVFIAGSKSYQMQKPVQGTLRSAFRAVRRSLLMSAENARNAPSPAQYRVINAASVDGRNSSDSSNSSTGSSNGGSYSNDSSLSSEDARTLKKLAAVFLLLLPYWICYFQMLGDTFLVQGLHMELDMGNSTSNNSSGIPAASLTLFNIIFLILALPFVDRWLYPWLSRSSRTAAGSAPSIHIRVTVGMLFSALALATAAVVEHFRQGLISSNQTIVQVIGNTIYDDVAPISIFVQIPQYALLGISEVFACVTGIEYAYSRSPKSMESLVMGCFWFVAGLGSFLGTGIMNAVSGGQRSYNNCPDNLSAYFYALLALQLGGAAVFYFVGRKLDLDDDSSDRSSGSGSTDSTEQVVPGPGDRIPTRSSRGQHA